MFVRSKFTYERTNEQTKLCLSTFEHVLACLNNHWTHQDPLPEPEFYQQTNEQLFMNKPMFVRSFVHRKLKFLFVCLFISQITRQFLWMNEHCSYPALVFKQKKFKNLPTDWRHTYTVDAKYCITHCVHDKCVCVRVCLSICCVWISFDEYHNKYLLKQAQKLWNIFKRFMFT